MILLALATLALGMHAQATAFPTPVPYTLPDESMYRPVRGPFPDGPFPCAEGLKLQRYTTGRPGNVEAQGARIPEDFGSPAGWYDVTPGPHEGDYRCVATDEKAWVPEPEIPAKRPASWPKDDERSERASPSCPAGQHYHSPDTQYPFTPQIKAHQTAAALNAMSMSGDGLCHDDYTDAAPEPKP